MAATERKTARRPHSLRRARLAGGGNGRLPPGFLVPTRRRALSARGEERRTAYLMVGPASLLVFAIALFPVAYSCYLSLHDASITGAGDWVGVDNYVALAKDPDFRTALLNTGVFTVASVALELTIGLAIALGLNQSFRGRGLVRTAVLLPWAFPVVVSALMWRLMLQDQVGIVTYFAQSVGLVDGSILSSQSALLISAILVDVWKTTPFMALLLLAGLQTIPPELIESADVDGANARQRLLRVTLPLLMPALLVAVLFRTLEAWGVYDLFWVMTDRQLESLSTFVYKGVRISQLEFATGTAAAVFTFVAALGIALVFLRLLASRHALEDY